MSYSLVAVLSIFIGIYGLFHLYLLIKARRAFGLERSGNLLLFLVLVVLLIAPIYARILEKQGYEIFFLLMSWIGNLWMGMIFVFVWISLPLDIYHVFMSLMQRMSNADLINLMLSRRQRFMLPAVLTVFVLAYGVYEAQHIKVSPITLHSAKLPPASKRVRIVQISDLHLGPMTFPARLQPVIDAVAEAKPDILVSTGDLIDGRLYHSAEVFELLASLQAPLGKFAVTGNHEYYAGLVSAEDFTQNAGFRLLHNQKVILDNGLAIVGVDDPASGDQVNHIETVLLSSVPKDNFTILLKHRPTVNPMASAFFDLQLSGHTHGGQMMPFGLMVKLMYPLKAGLLKLSSGSYLYTSRGTGTWGPPFRLLAPPEVAVIDLLPAAKKPSQPKE
jgi:predicted MPP superfamily phosphohydrolase